MYPQQPQRMGYCFSCRRYVRPEPGAIGKIGGGTIGLSAGAQTNNLLAALFSFGLGVWIGHMIDKYVAPVCPLCGALLRFGLGGGLADFF